MGIESGSMRRLLDDLPAIRVPAHAEVFREGDYGSCMYAIRQGAVAVQHGGRTVNRLGPGVVFGETALLGQVRRGATVKATEETDLVAVDRSRFARLVRQEPVIALEMMALVLNRAFRADALYREPGPLNHGHRCEGPTAGAVSAAGGGKRWPGPAGRREPPPAP